MNVQQTIDTLQEDKKYSAAHIRHLLNHVTLSVEAPNEFKIGDAYIDSCGAKRRPVIIIKVMEDFVIGIPLSTTEDCLNLVPYKSRFFGEGFFSNQLVTAKIDYVKDSFVGVFDNDENIKEAVEKIKKFYFDTI